MLQQRYELMWPVFLHLFIHESSPLGTEKRTFYHKFCTNIKKLPVSILPAQSIIDVVSQCWNLLIFLQNLCKSNPLIPFQYLVILHFVVWIFRIILPSCSRSVIYFGDEWWRRSLIEYVTAKRTHKQNRFSFN